MNKNRAFKQVVFVSFVTLILLACGGGALAATATSLPPNPPTPANTATAKPTSTPLPTATEIPATPTPAPVGVPIKYGSLEITLLAVATHDLIVPGGNFYWYSNPGDTYLDLGVLVKNTDPGNPVKIQWNQVYIVDANNDVWSPTFGDIKMVESGKKEDPFSVGINTELDSNAFVEFDKDTYMRLIYYTAKDTKATLFFGIEGSPLISFQMK
jgi:hypothetical protein